MSFSKLFRSAGICDITDLALGIFVSFSPLKFTSCSSCCLDKKILDVKDVLRVGSEEWSWIKFLPSTPKKKKCLLLTELLLNGELLYCISVVFWDCINYQRVNYKSPLSMRLKSCRLFTVNYIQLNSHSQEYHPSIMYSCLFLCRVVEVCCKLSSSLWGERQDRSPLHCSALRF